MPAAAPGAGDLRLRPQKIANSSKTAAICRQLGVQKQIAPRPLPQPTPSSGRAFISAPICAPAPRWGGSGVGMVRAECVDWVENRSSSLSDSGLGCGRRPGAFDQHPPRQHVAAPLFAARGRLGDSVDSRQRGTLAARVFFRGERCRYQAPRRLIRPNVKEKPAGRRSRLRRSRFSPAASGVRRPLPAPPAAAGRGGAAMSLKCLVTRPSGDDPPRGSWRLTENFTPQIVTKASENLTSS